MNYDTNECFSFIEQLGINLVAYQKEMIRMMCENKYFIPSRCNGRTIVAKAFRKYVAHIQDDKENL